MVSGALLFWGGVGTKKCRPVPRQRQGMRVGQILIAPLLAIAILGLT